jgi:hypothetical protein
MAWKDGQEDRHFRQVGHSALILDISGGGVDNSRFGKRGGLLGVLR